MPYITIPQDEAISLLQEKVLQDVDRIRTIEATERGPRLGIKVLPLLPLAYVTVEFERFSDETAYFRLRNLPHVLIPFISRLRLVDGVEVEQDCLMVRAEELLHTQLQINSLKILDFKWENGSYIIQAKVA